jgi:Ca2+-binding EF-hand superfamily protein
MSERQYFHLASFPIPDIYVPYRESKPVVKFGIDSTQRTYRTPNAPSFNKVGGLLFEQLESRQKAIVQNMANDTSLLYLKRLKETTGLAAIDFKTTLNLLTESAIRDEIDCLFHTKETFTLGISGLLKIDKRMVDELFGFFDADSNGQVDLLELLSGCMLLCKGTEKEKLSTVFTVFDTDHDGFISMDEMFHFMNCVFRVILTPEILREINQQGSQIETAEDLAASTAIECFKKADLNSDGKLSQTEFINWFGSRSYVR